RSAVSRQLQRCEVLLAVDEKLPAVLQGSQKPGSAVEALDLAWLCRQPYKRLYHASARLYADAFAAQPKLADDRSKAHRYNAACAAALAAAGQGQDAGTLDDKERSRLRAQALDWLRADLAAWTNVVRDDPKARPKAQHTLAHRQKDSDLASLRDQEPLSKLPPDERK